jgi:tetrahydromethanopterin S-methyltransferase subunit B
VAAGYTNEMANGIIVGSRIVASAAVTLAYYDYTAMDNCNVKYLVAFIEV